MPTLNHSLDRDHILETLHLKMLLFLEGRRTPFRLIPLARNPVSVYNSRNRSNPFVGYDKRKIASPR